MNKKQEYKEKYCYLSEISLDFYDENFVTLACDCGEEGCEGWCTISKNHLFVEKLN